MTSTESEGKKEKTIKSQRRKKCLKQNNLQGKMRNTHQNPPATCTERQTDRQTDRDRQRVKHRYKSFHFTRHHESVLH